MNLLTQARQQGESLMDLDVTALHSCIVLFCPLKGSFSKCFQRSHLSPKTHVGVRADRELMSQDRNNSPVTSRLTAEGTWPDLLPDECSSRHVQPASSQLHLLCTWVKGKTERPTRMDTSWGLNYLFFRMVGVSGKVTVNLACTCNCPSTGDGKDAIKPTAHRGRGPLPEKGLFQGLGMHSSVTRQGGNNCALSAAVKRMLRLSSVLFQAVFFWWSQAKWPLMINE